MEKDTARKKVPYHRKPADMSVEDWQIELRKQYAEQQNFKFKNTGTHPVYSDFNLYNPKSGKEYKVSIRDNIKSHHYCNCPDFTINGLGTCKHIEYLLFYFRKYKKYQKHLGKSQDHGYSSLSIFYGKEKNLRLKKADHVKQFSHEDKYFDQNGFFKLDDFLKLETFIQEAKREDPSFILYPDVMDMLVNLKKERSRLKRVEELLPNGTDSKILDNIIKANLYPYQKEGVLKIVKTGRILLADDMGLGKTVQAIAAMQIFTKYFDLERTLIICPTSLKYQWKREIEKFAERDSLVVEGLIHKRKADYRANDSIKIISYGAARNDVDSILQWSPDLVIIDEAQRIKNWKTKTAQAVKKIESEHAIVVTGTPLENRLEELHSIVEYIDRYKFGALFRFLDNHQIMQEDGKLKGYTNLRSINATLEDILLRRTKKEIADQLPNRSDKNFFVQMTDEQKNDHSAYYDGVAKLVNKWRRTGYLSEDERQKLLTLLNCMRMVCDSTYILDEKTNHGNKIKEVSILLDDLLEDDGNKIVLFSQWKRMFALVVKELKKKNVEFLYLNGDVPAKEREAIIKIFQEDPSIRVFLSTDAGGVGVNLQKANILINIDIPWNPAVLEQRIGRIYRLGQKKHINVFNLIASKSIEHRILYLLEFKRSVFSGVIEDEGEDEVMIEGFMESVKALTEVEFESKEYINRIRDDEQDLAAEVNAPYLEKDNEPNLVASDSTRDKNPEIPHQPRKNSFIKKILKRIKKVFSRKK